MLGRTWAPDQAMVECWGGALAKGAVACAETRCLVIEPSDLFGPMDCRVVQVAVTS